MRNLILTLVLGASFGVGGAFAASNPPSPTSSSKAANVLGKSKVEKVLGDGALVAAKEEANRENRIYDINEAAVREAEGARMEEGSKLAKLGGLRDSRAEAKRIRDKRLEIARRRADLEAARLEYAQRELETLQDGGQTGAEAG